MHFSAVGDRRHIHIHIHINTHTCTGIIEESPSVDHILTVYPALKFPDEVGLWIVHVYHLIMVGITLLSLLVHVHPNADTPRV